MRQFILPEHWAGEKSCVIEGGRARYLARVLRLARGDAFPGLDSRGNRWLCRIGELSDDRIVLAVGELPESFDTGGLKDVRGTGNGEADAANKETIPGFDGSKGIESPFPPITLVQGLPKGNRMDLIVRQAAEAGVSRVIPLLTRRSVLRLGKEAEGRHARWERIAREALQQSGSGVSTRIDEVLDLGALPAALGKPPQGEGRRLAILLHETLLESPLAQPSLHRYLTDKPEEIVLCVGPEGGFAPDEVVFLLAEGFEALKLAGAVLRTETAALYAVAAVETILSERSSWIPKPL